jgi:hypothetical protein
MQSIPTTQSETVIHGFSICLDYSNATSKQTHGVVYNTFHSGMLLAVHVRMPMVAFLRGSSGSELSVEKRINTPRTRRLSTSTPTSSHPSILCSSLPSCHSMKNPIQSTSLNPSSHHVVLQPGVPLSRLQVAPASPTDSEHRAILIPVGCDPSSTRCIFLVHGNHFTRRKR